MAGYRAHLALTGAGAPCSPALQPRPLAVQAVARAPLSHKKPHRRPVLARVASQAQPSANGAKALAESRGPSTTSAEEDGGDACEVFVDAQGDILEVMCCDYGFRSGYGRLYQDDYGSIPRNFFALGWENFKQEYKQLRRSFRYNEYESIGSSMRPSSPLGKVGAWVGSGLVRSLAWLDARLEAAKVVPPLRAPRLPAEVLDEEGRLLPECGGVREKLRDLKLDDKVVWQMEEARSKRPGAPRAPWIIKAAYIALCWTLDVIYEGRPIQRFWFLETVARMPYFSYISMLHLYESLGWWRAGAALRKVHFAEEWNELHHLQIMESLGGDQLWIDRFMAQHAAVFYFWVLIVFYVFAPNQAYLFSELVEGHATDTYAHFVEANKEVLSTLPPPLVALEYYKSGDLYLFDQLQTNSKDPVRRPECRTLYDVFVNIRDDEEEHVKTMHACQDYSIMKDLAQKIKSNRAEPQLKSGQVKTLDTTGGLVGARAEADETRGV